MKKLLLSIFLIVLMFAFVSCEEEVPVNPGAAIPAGVPDGITPRSIGPDDILLFGKMVEDGKDEFEKIAAAFDDLEVDLDEKNFKDISGRIVFENTQKEDENFDYEYWNGTDDKVAKVTFNGFNAAIGIKEGKIVISGSVKVAIDAPDLNEKFKTMTEYTFQREILNMDIPIPYTYMDGSVPTVVPYDDDKSDLYNLHQYILEEACSRSVMMFCDVDFQDFSATYMEIASVMLNGKCGLVVEIESELTLGVRAENLDVSVVLNGAQLGFSFKNFRLALTLRLGGLFGGTGVAGAKVDFEAESLKISGKSGDVEINAEISGHFLMDDEHTTVGGVKSYTKSVVDVDGTVGVAVSVGENSVGCKAAVEIDITDPALIADFELLPSDFKPVVARINADYVKPDEFLAAIFELIPAEE